MTKQHNDIVGKSTSWQQQNKSNTTTLKFWTALWVLSMALTNFGPRFIWDFNMTLTVIAVLLNFSLGLKMVVANINHIKGLDEMQQRIQLNSMGIDASSTSMGTADTPVG